RQTGRSRHIKTALGSDTDLTPDFKRPRSDNTLRGFFFCAPLMTTVSNDPVARVLTRIVSWRFVAPAVLTLFICAEIGARLRLPPAALVVACFTAAAAILLAKLIVWVATSSRYFGREERLAALISLLAIAGGWYIARTWTYERQFDALIQAQNNNLVLTL